MKELVDFFIVVNEETGMVDIVRSGFGVVVFSICFCGLLSAFYVIKSAMSTKG